MKDYIKNNPVLMHSVLCDKIGWSTSSFSQWLSGKRSIPHGKEALLKEVLTEYGYKEL